ncbi:MAG: DUF308 domain-containing protein [Spirochaetales bacterium]|nr:DUF308 domain-containing protein [Spirochaetales bacterium]
MLTFLAILKWISLVVAIILFILSIVEFLTDEEDIAPWFFLFAIIFGIGFFVFGAFIKNMNEYETVNKMSKKEVKSLISEKVSPENFLCEIDEPKYFIVAPMSYDISEFEKKVSSYTKSKDDEVLILMDEAILKFQNYIDDMVGVSFIDRSKIAQIEKEHAFQLSDWSNEKKTAEIGHALNANVLLFLENFSYLKDNGGEYRFRANFVDMNSMQTTSHSIVYTGRKLTASSESLGRISFRNFNKISQIENPFSDEIIFSMTKPMCVSQPKNTMQQISPLTSTRLLDFSMYTGYKPNTFMLRSKPEKLAYSSFSIDGIDSITLKDSDSKAIKSGKYKFEPCEQNITKIGDKFYTDGKIGRFSIKTDTSFESYDVFTKDYYEFFFYFGSKELTDMNVNYYLQVVKN